VWDLFFNARSAAASTADTIHWKIREILLEFVASAPNRLVMQTSDFRDLFDSAMPQTHGFTTRDPAPLLLIESIQQRIELPMLIPDGIAQPRSTDPTTTSVARLPCHDAPTFLLDWPRFYTITPNSRNRCWTGT
jgi:hypothetical protein